MTPMTSLTVLYCQLINLPNKTSQNLFKLVIFGISQLWDLIETWGFPMDDLCELPDSSIFSADKFTKQNLTKPLQISDFWVYLSFGT